MIVKVIKIGSSVGVLLPKAIVKRCPIKDEIRLEVIRNSIVIRTVDTQPRQGWLEQFLKAGSSKDDEVLIGQFGNSFDKEEWTW